MKYAIAAIGLLGGLTASAAHGMGSDYGSEPVRLENWTERFAGVVNEHRVHGWWMNEYEGFFLAGDAVALTTFLEAYAALPGTAKRVTLGDDPIVVRSPWSESLREEVADWTLHQEHHAGQSTLFPIPRPEWSIAEWRLVEPRWRTSVTVDVTRIDLENLRVPFSLEVIADEGADDAVRRFVEAHQAQRERVMRDSRRHR